MSDSFWATMKIIPYMKICSLIRTIVAARLQCRANLESGALHIGYVLCYTLVQYEHLFGPVAEVNLTRSDDWNSLRWKKEIHE